MLGPIEGACLTLFLLSVFPALLIKTGHFLASVGSFVSNLWSEMPLFPLANRLHPASAIDAIKAYKASVGRDDELTR